MLAYRNLEVHQRALALADRVLELLESPPFEKRFWLQNQIGAAVCSVSSNIAEGNGRSTPLDYAAFVDRARGSLFEVDNWLSICAMRGWCPSELRAELDAEVDQISAMLFRLAASLRNKSTLESRTNTRL